MEKEWKGNIKRATRRKFNRLKIEILEALEEDDDEFSQYYHGIQTYMPTSINTHTNIHTNIKYVFLAEY